MNETIATTQAAPSAADALALRQLQHVGAAYLLIFVLLFVFAWRATSATKALAERMDALERDGSSTGGREPARNPAGGRELTGSGY